MRQTESTTCRTVTSGRINTMRLFSYRLVCGSLFTGSATFILHIDFCIFVRCTNMSIVCITATLISSLSQACPCILSNTCTTLHQLLPVWCCKYSRILRALLVFSLSLSIDFFLLFLSPSNIEYFGNESYTSPFAFQWNIMHLLISPAASHSGWEDNMQSDLYHYLHHRYFECNYGTQGMPMDKMFGTFRDKLKEKGTTYNGGSEEKVDEKSVRLHDTKANFSKTLPEVGFVIYMSLNILLWGILYCAFKQIPLLDGGTKRIDCPTTMALLISVGPIAIAQAMTMLTEASRKPRPVLYPFHKDKVIHTMFHLSVSILVCVAPVFLLVNTMLSSPGEAFF